eukprot:275944-Rhodomonas_salina.2
MSIALAESFGQLGSIPPGTPGTCLPSKLAIIQPFSAAGIPPQLPVSVHSARVFLSDLVIARKQNELLAVVLRYFPGHFHPVLKTFENDWQKRR